MTFTKLMAVAVFTVAASTAFAKGHDQSSEETELNDGIPGKNAGAETAAAAQTLGNKLGGGKGPGGKSPGKSGQANASDDAPETNE